MKRYLKLSTTLLALYVVLNGCSVDKLTAPTPQSALSAVITTTMDGAHAFASVLQARDYFVSSTILFKTLGEHALDIMATDPGLANANTDVACAGGGTYNYSGSVASGSYDLTVTFSGCRENQFQYEGAMKVTGSPGDISVKLGDAGTLNIFYFNTDYTVLIAYLKAENSFTMTGSGTLTDAAYTIAPSGKITNFDYFLLDTFTLNYFGASTDYALITDPATGDETTTITVHGYFTESWISAGLTMTLTNFRVDRTRRYDAATLSFIADDTSLGGTASFNYRPNNYCFEGQLAITTTTPVRNDYSQGGTTQGDLSINGIATATYNADKTVNVTVGGTTLSYNREYDLMKLCNYSALEQTIPPLLGPTGTAIGDKMTVTLTWFGPTGSASDMDLHVKYYASTAPVATDAEAWHMDWHQGSSCSNPRGLSFSDGRDLDGDGVCDVGLDFDDVNGYGPEHITALQIPTGYYVVSVNSYGLHGDPSATLYLAIHIGDYIYGPFTTTLADSDGEGTDALSWFHLADVRVNGDGTVDVLAPNTSLTPWH